MTFHTITMSKNVMDVKMISSCLQTLFNLGLHFCTTGSAEVLSVGASVSVEKTIKPEDVRLFSELSGDWNPIHSRVHNPVVHGALLNGLVSGLIGTKLPGPGTLLLKQTLRFPNPCYVGDTVLVTVEITEVRRLVGCKFNITSKRHGNVVMEGDAKLLVKDI